MRNGILGEDASKDFIPVRRASDTCRRLAIRRRKGPQTDQRDCRIPCPNARYGAVRQMHRESIWNRIGGKAERRVFKEWTAGVIICQRLIRNYVRVVVRNRLQIKTRLSRGRILIVNRKQAMALRANISDLEQNVPRQL